jgi:DNA-directed RNA polymerase
MNQTTDLMSLQVALEDRMVSAGIARYENNIEERGLSVAAPGKALRARALEPTALAITIALFGVDEAREEFPELSTDCLQPGDSVSAMHAKLGFPSRRGKPRPGAKFVREVGAHILADLTMRRAIDGASREEKVVKVTKAIGAAVEWHVKDKALYQAYRALWNKLQEKLKTTQNASFRRRSIDGSVESMREWAREEGHTELLTRLDDVKGLEWTDEDMIDAGIFLLDCFCKATSLVTTEEVRSGKHNSKAIVRFTEGTEAWLKAQNEYQSLLRPVYMPMVVEPKPWSALNDGGYLDNSKARVPFIMTRAKNEHDRETADMGDAYDAVNLIQGTPLRVNQSVLGVMRQAWNTGSGVGRVPAKYFEDGARAIPELPSSWLVEGKVRDEVRETSEYRELMLRRRDAHEYNALFRAEVGDFTRLMTAAEEYAQFDQFWLPYKLDWRQRCYPVVSLLSPQGDQFNRGLVEFARGKRMGDSENSAAWLAIHGANVYGVDKVPFEDRIAWVEAHQSEIISSAIDPFGTKFWQEADGGAKAWPFLAFCFEWTAYLIAGDEHVTHLPIALDGSNSGLQHLSAMVRDTEGAQATNVAPCDVPADIYTEICEKVTVALGHCEGEAEEWARIWLDAGIDRKICKQPTMTYTYSATLAGMTKQIENALGELDRKAQSKGKPSYLTFTRPDQSNAEAARFLGPIVLQAIQGRLPKAAAAMEFLVECARVAAQEDIPLRWVTPVGVPVVQFYPKLTEQRKDIYIDGRRHQLILMKADPDRIDKRAQAYGVSPNFVHSMDSTHLLWTVLCCNDAFGIEDFSMIHDSFGTHATGCDLMALVLRQMFVNLYSEDRLTQFRNALVERLPEELAAELPPVPEMGTFDLESVLESQYFFA